ncbi:MAG: GGDEF domain-containing protein [Treponema sp.]
MVIYFSVVFCVLFLCQILFFIFALNRKARDDKNFIVLQSLSIAVLLSIFFNSMSLHFGETGYFVSKVLCSLFNVFFILIVALFAKMKVSTFSDYSKYTNVVVFIIFIAALCACSISIINIFTEDFFSYIICWLHPFFTEKENPHLVDTIVSFRRGALWSAYAFFLLSLLFIYGILVFTRIAMRTAVNSTYEIVNIIICVIQFSFFVILIERPASLMTEMCLFCFTLPFAYYFFIYQNKFAFVKKVFRSKIFDNSSSLSVIFNADDVLADFNDSAREFFAFSSGDINSLTKEKFITEYVPLGTLSADSLLINQLFLTGRNSESKICQLEYKRVSYFKKMTICSFFIIRDISEVVQNFVNIQQASMKDKLTGLAASHFLARKIKEINMYRRFPYTAASCIVRVKDENTKSFNLNIALIHVAECIKKQIRDCDIASYTNGNIVLLFPSELETAQDIIDKILVSIKNEVILNFEVDFQYGLSCRKNPDDDIQDVINQAHSIMFEKLIKR